MIHPTASSDLVMFLPLGVKYDALIFKRVTSAVRQTGFAAYILVKNKFPIGMGVQGTVVVVINFDIPTSDKSSGGMMLDICKVHGIYTILRKIVISVYTCK